MINAPSVRSALAAIVVLGLASADVLHAQSSQPQPLTAIRFEGLQRYRQEDLLRLSGLRTGQMVTAAQLTQVARGLADTGLFAEVRYRYTTTTAGISVEYQIREAPWTVPVVFDNFVSIPDEELLAAVRAEVPGFDGMAVEGGSANDRIASALQRAMAARGIRGRVEATSSVDLIKNRNVFLFAMRDSGLNLSICAVRLPGASGVSERDLQALTAPFLGDDYSRASLDAFAGGALQRHYRQRGYWGATFESATGLLGAGCEGVTATIRLSEGVAYRWAGARWSGVSAFPAARLDELLGVAVGALAEEPKINDGLKRVDAEYEKAGYLLKTQTVTQELDAGSQRVTFDIAVTEGTQFKMGTFLVEGVPAADAATITTRWRIKTGEVFDGSYLRSFVRDNLGLLQERRDGLVIAPDLRLDQETGRAHLTFRPASRPARQ
jgi:outer membrane protein assembly factor BamA